MKQNERDKNEIVHLEDICFCVITKIVSNKNVPSFIMLEKITEMGSVTIYKDLNYELLLHVSKDKSVLLVDEAGCETDSMWVLSVQNLKSYYDIIHTGYQRLKHINNEESLLGQELNKELNLFYEARATNNYANVALGKLQDRRTFSIIKSFYCLSYGNPLNYIPIEPAPESSYQKRRNQLHIIKN